MFVNVDPDHDPHPPDVEGNTPMGLDHHIHTNGIVGIPLEVPGHTILGDIVIHHPHAPVLEGGSASELPIPDHLASIVRDLHETDELAR